MRHTSILGTIIMASFLLFPISTSAGKWNAADYPLRVHIFQFNTYSHYYRPGGGPYASLETADGEGRANLYENSQPQGFDFAYQCGTRLMVSAGYETYLARWRKPGRELEILLPVLGGKSGDMNSCDLKVTLKANSAYYKHNGLLNEEPAADFKDWMVKHQYDPEHGLNEPIKLPAAPSPSGQPAAAQAGSSAGSAQ